MASPLVSLDIPRRPTLTNVRLGLDDTLTLTRRDLLVWFRNPAFLFFTIIQPLMFVLLFRYVFGGAIPVKVPGGYVNFLMPGIIAQSAAFASFGTAIALARQLQKGVIDRFRAMPMARSAVLLGRLTADTLRLVVTVLLILAVGYAVGFRFHNGFVPALAMVLLGVVFGVVICTVSAFVGLALKDEESVGSFGLVWLFPLTFVSAAFVPVLSMPGWLQSPGCEIHTIAWDPESSTVGFTIIYLLSSGVGAGNGLVETLGTPLAVGFPNAVWTVDR